MRNNEQIDFKTLFESKENKFDSQRVFSAVFYQSPVMNSISDAVTRRFIEVNDNFLKVCELTKEEAIGKTALELNLISDFTQPDEIRKVIKENGYANDVLMKIQTRSGAIKWLSTSVHAVTINEKDYLITAMVDVTERKQAEEKLFLVNQKLETLNAQLEQEVEERTKKIMATEKRYKDTLDNMLEGAQIIGFDWRYQYVNKSLEKQGKYPKEEVLGYTMMEKYPGLETTNVFKAIKRCFDERVVVQMITEFVFPDTTVSWFELSIQPVPEGVFILSVDITERKKAEKEITKLNEGLEQKIVERTNQLESVNKELEAFTYSVSHDLRAPLRAINGYAKILQEDYLENLDDAGKSSLTAILKNSKRMGELIDDLLAFSRLGRTSKAHSDINMTGLVKSVLIEELEGKSNSVFIVLRNDELIPAKGDQALIKQVWVNLISNAIKYSQKNPKTIIEIGSYAQNGMATYYVKDNGAGFDMKYYNKLFGVFHRLHSQEEFEGTGIGLAIVKKVIERHNGKIWAESQLNKGSCFYFTLPSIYS
jgi:PAS domain S-box-containing protein